VDANTKYKDSVFSFLFSDPDLLRELYCALEGVDLPPDVPVIINTLRNVLFMGINNDISFEICGKLVVLIEHQSTINPNMALRLLMYIARVYEKIVGPRVAARKALKQMANMPSAKRKYLHLAACPHPPARVLCAVQRSGSVSRRGNL